MKLLNIGCGSVFHPSWMNIDIASSSPNVLVYDIRRGVPYPDALIDACYSSHVVEHLAPGQAEFLLRECNRILKPQGVIRIVVPDLEAIVRHYLLTLERVEEANREDGADYDWMMLELYDQVVRSFSGGEMGRYLSDPAIKNRAFVVSRIGMQAEGYWEDKAVVEKMSLAKRIQAKRPSDLIRRLRTDLAKNFVNLLAGRQAHLSFEEGLFRNSGEIHRWMYDRYSLRRLLERAGFVEVDIYRADESRIPQFNSYGLDVVNGRVRKPDSLFMEGFKA